MDTPGTFTTRTTSPYFSPNMATAPLARASLMPMLDVSSATESPIHSVSAMRLVSRHCRKEVPDARTVDELLDARELSGRRRLGRVEVEAQALEVHQRARLGDVAADDLLERSLQQVRRSVVAARLAKQGP